MEENYLEQYKLLQDGKPKTVLEFSDDEEDLEEIKKEIEEEEIDKIVQDALFKKGNSLKIGTNKPGGFWQPMVDKINLENGTTHKRIQYGGSGDTRKALLSGEVDYVFLSTRHTYKLEKAGANCFLVGEALMRQEDVTQAVKTLLTPSTFLDGQLD